MKKWKLLILAVLLNLPISAFAAGAAESAQSNYIYHEVLTMCLNPSVGTKLNLAYQSGSEFANGPMALSNFHLLWNESEYLDKLWNHPGYQKALSECFGNDEAKKKSFTNTLLATDIAGKIGGALAGGLLYWYVPWKVFSGIGKALGFGVGKLAGETAGKITETGFHLSLMGWFLGSTAHAAYKTRQTGFTPEMIEQNPALAKAVKDFENGEIKKEEIGGRSLIYLTEFMEQEVSALSQQVDPCLLEMPPGVNPLE